MQVFYQFILTSLVVVYCCCNMLFVSIVCFLYFIKGFLFVYCLFLSNYLWHVQECVVNLSELFVITSVSLFLCICRNMAHRRLLVLAELYQLKRYIESVLYMYYMYNYIQKLLPIFKGLGNYVKCNYNDWQFHINL